MVAEPQRLPDELRSVAAWVACIADARPLPELSAILARAGFVIEHVERHDAALARLLERVDARLRTAALVGGDFLEDGVDEGRALVQAAREALTGGSLGYASILARRA
jgi:arsenite methyltransferase